MDKLLRALNSLRILVGAGTRKCLLSARIWLVKTLDPRWAAIAADCTLIKAPGGAAIYQYRGGEGGSHKYACPACYEKKQLGLLQPANSGKFRCPVCTETYQVAPDFGTPEIRYSNQGSI